MRHGLLALQSEQQSEELHHPTHTVADGIKQDKTYSGGVLLNQARMYVPCEKR